MLGLSRWRPKEPNGSKASLGVPEAHDSVSIGARAGTAQIAGEHEFVGASNFAFGKQRKIHVTQQCGVPKIHVQSTQGHLVLSLAFAFFLHCHAVPHV